MDADEPVAVFSTTDPLQAEFIKAELQAEGIDCDIEGAHQAGLAGVLQIRLFVPAKDADRARAFLKKHDEG